MLASYSNACSQSLYELSCFVCLNRLESSNSPDVYNPGWNVIGLPQCKHLIHQSCYNHWASHSRELACRDVSVEKQVTCPLCKVKVGENTAFVNADCDFELLDYDNPDPDPELPLIQTVIVTFNHFRCFLIRLSPLSIRVIILMSAIFLPCIK